VELRRAKRPALLDAAEQLSRVGTPLLGAVVLPRLNPMRVDQENLPAVTLPAERRPAPSPVPLNAPEPRAEERREPRPDETAVLDTDRTQPMRRISASPSPSQARPRPVELDDVTAIIDLGAAGAGTKTAEKPGEQPDEK